MLLSDLYNHKSVNRLYGKWLMLLCYFNKNIKICYLMFNLLLNLSIRIYAMLIFTLLVNLSIDFVKKFINCQKTDYTLLSIVNALTFYCDSQ